MKKCKAVMILCILFFAIIKPSVSAATKVTLYVYDEVEQKLKPIQVEGKSDANTLIKLLKKHQMIPKKVRINSFEITKENGIVYAHIDMTREFKEYIETMGTFGEMICMYSLIHTIIVNQGVERVILTLEGEILETGHMIYDEYMEFDQKMVVDVH